MDDRFVMGVQWHAETLVDEAGHLALFERLVEAARIAERDSGEQEDSDAHAI
jgi:gamma-glutamyl-gamma-aminobutyrate hydrolase PuuD